MNSVKKFSEFSVKHVLIIWFESNIWLYLLTELAKHKNLTSNWASTTSYLLYPILLCIILYPILFHARLNLLSLDRIGEAQELDIALGLHDMRFFLPNSPSLKRMLDPRISRDVSHVCPKIPGYGKAIHYYIVDRIGEAQNTKAWHRIGSPRHPIHYILSYSTAEFIILLTG